jgi:hypothetical protein
MTKHKTYTEDGNHHRRGATYTDKPIFCKNASTIGFGKYSASRGDMVEYYYELNDGSREYHWGRMLSRVDSPELSKEIPKVKEHLCVVEFAWGGQIGFVRWVNPDHVTTIYAPPKAFPAWFFQPELPPIADVLAADRHGSLTEHYIDRWTAERRTKVDGPEQTGHDHG